MLSKHIYEDWIKVSKVESVLSVLSGSLGRMRRSTVAISAPGKVLLAGGYLVLDRDHTGLVFGLDARIHVHVQKLPTSPGVVLSEIIVRSPQFNDAEWRYGYRETEDQGGIEVVQLKG